MVDRHCERCNRRFFGSSNRQKRCNPCRRAVADGESRFPPQDGALPVRACDWCGAVFKPRTWNQRFHSGFCQTEARKLISAELYNRDHKATKRAWAPAVARGGVRCARGADCKFAEFVNGVRVGGFILPGQRWDLGHVDGGGPNDYAGPEHATCNRAAPMLNARRRRAA